jgi:hypothetical protein
MFRSNGNVAFVVLDSESRGKKSNSSRQRGNALQEAGTTRALRVPPNSINGSGLGSARLRLGLAARLTCGVVRSRRLDAFGILTNHRAPDQSSTTLPSSYLTCIAFLEPPNASHLQPPPTSGINTTGTLQPGHTHETSTPDARRLSPWRLCCLRAAWNDRRKVQPYRETWCISTLSRGTRWRRYVRITGP